MSKDSKISTKLSLGLPKSIGNKTVDELLCSPNTELHISKGKVSARTTTDDGVVAIKYSSYETGRRTISASNAPKKQKKSDYIEDIRSMKREGHSQKDIAFDLGMSPSYVCQLLKKHK